MKSESSTLPICETDRNTVEAELHRLLGERRFSGAPQMSAFLKYIVTQTLDGNADRIKAYSVGVDALGKPDSFDAQNDPSVRVLALRLRKTLSTIYATATSAHAIIELKVGTYVPEFLKPVSASVEPASLGMPTSEDLHLPAAARAFGTINTAGGQAVSGSDLTAASIQPESQASANRFVSVQTQSSEPTEAAATESNSTTPSKWVLICALLLVGAAWQLGSSHALRSTEPVSGMAADYASISPSSLRVLDISPKAASAASTIPTMFLDHGSEQSETEHLLTVLLASSFVKSGTVNVIKQVLVSESITIPAGSYQLVLSELNVEGQSRVETQVVSLQTGEVLMAKTLTRSNHPSEELTGTELENIETMAASIVSASGPVYRDYCLRYTSDSESDCKST